MEPHTPPPVGLKRSISALVAVIIIAIARNASEGALSVALDVALGLACAVFVLLIAWFWSQHRHHHLGLTNWASGLAHGGAFALAVAIGLLAAIAVPTFRASLLANAPNDYPNTMWVLAALVVVPLGTVLFEEVLFRGILWSYMLTHGGPRIALWGTSALFALWHVPSVLLRHDSAAGGDLPVAAALLATLATTFAGGLLFGWLRQRSGSLAAPIIAHIATNSFGFLALAAASSLSS